MRLKFVLPCLCSALPMLSGCTEVALAQALSVIAYKQGKKQALPILKTSKDVLDVRVGEVQEKGRWGIAPEVKPDVITVVVPPGKSETVTFISDLGEITFKIR